MTFDSGALIALERGHRTIAIAVDDLARVGRTVTVPTVVVAEVWRGARTARIARLLKDCNVEPLDERLARRAGILLGRTGLSDVADAVVVASAAGRGDVVLTSDPEDLQALAAGLDPALAVSIEAI